MTKNAAWPEGSFLDSLATGVLATDPKGKIVYANAASEILSGASKNRLLGISAEAVFPSARRWTERFLSDTVRGEPTLTERTEMFCPSNPTESRKVRVTVSRFPGTGGILMEVSDLGAVLIAENEAQKVGLSETSRQVLRNLAHEIKNPLGGIRGAAQLLEGELTNPELREYTGVIISEADRLQNLVDRLLAPYRTGLTSTSTKCWSGSGRSFWLSFRRDSLLSGTMTFRFQHSGVTVSSCCRCFSISKKMQPRRLTERLPKARLRSG